MSKSTVFSQEFSDLKELEEIIVAARTEAQQRGKAPDEVYTFEGTFVLEEETLTDGSKVLNASIR